MIKIREILAKAFTLFVVMTVICGGIYPLTVTCIARGLFKEKSEGSVIEIDGVKYGSELLGQQYTDEEHMWGRIMILDTGTYTDEEGNILIYATPSNKSPAGEEFEKAVADRVAMIKEANPEASAEAVPVELVTCSGSGLDPHISPAAAEYQVPRIAKAKHMTEDEVREIIKRYTTGKFLGIFGEETVNVLKTNLALDGILTE